MTLQLLTLLHSGRSVSVWAEVTGRSDYRWPKCPRLTGNRDEMVIGFGTTRLLLQFKVYQVSYRIEIMGAGLRLYAHIHVKNIFAKLLRLSLTLPNFLLQLLLILLSNHIEPPAPAKTCPVYS